MLYTAGMLGISSKPASSIARGTVRAAKTIFFPNVKPTPIPFPVAAPFPQVTVTWPLVTRTGAGEVESGDWAESPSGRMVAATRKIGRRI